MSSKMVAAKGVEVSVGDKVARFFSSHELDRGMPPQWIHGKVSGFKVAGKRGNKASTTWWTLSFEPPAVKPLCCNTEEVVLMLHAAEEFRLKRHALEKQLGKHLVVTWSAEDSALSITDWENDLRICVLQKYIPRTQQFVLQFKCGYVKIVDGNVVVQLVDDSEAFYAATKAKTKRSVDKATREWKITEDEPGPTHVVFDAQSSSNVQGVEDSIRLALAKRLEQRKAQEEANNKAQEEAKNLKIQQERDSLLAAYAETLQKQRANILRLENENATAAQLQAKEQAVAKAIQEAEAEKLLQQTEVEAALLLQQQEEAAVQLQAQELAAAKLVKEKEAAAALLLQQQVEAAVQLQAQELAAAKLLEELAAAKLLQQTEAEAALLLQQQEEAAVQLQVKELAAAKMREEIEAATALLLKQQEEAAVQLQAQELAAAKLLEETEAAAALLQQQNDDARDDSMGCQEVAGWGRGSYPRQDINKTIDCLRSYGMGKGWSNLCDLPDVLPTFYVDDENGTDSTAPMAGSTNIHVLPPPPPNDQQPLYLKQDTQQQVVKVEETAVAKKRKRRGTRMRVPPKVDKHEDEDANDDVDSDVEFVHLSCNSARRILWQRGHAAQLPSAKADIIRRATVANLADAYDPLCQLGFAIIEDMTEVFAPKNRCTREQRDYIEKCECTL
jgi:chemotaxis protein histidine kinase CheA